MQTRTQKSKSTKMPGRPEGNAGNGEEEEIELTTDQKLNKLLENVKEVTAIRLDLKQLKFMVNLYKNAIEDHCCTHKIYLSLEIHYLKTFLGVVQKTGAVSKPRISRVVSKSDSDHGTATTATEPLG